MPSMAAKISTIPDLLYLFLPPYAISKCSPTSISLRSIFGHFLFSPYPASLSSSSITVENCWVKLRRSIVRSSCVFIFEPPSSLGRCALPNSSPILLESKISVSYWLTGDSLAINASLRASAGGLVSGSDCSSLVWVFSMIIVWVIGERGQIS